MKITKVYAEKYRCPKAKPIANGTVSPSQAPGAGLDINREVLKDYRVG